jgi:hypothetical protein
VWWVRALVTLRTSFFATRPWAERDANLVQWVVQGRCPVVYLSWEVGALVEALWRVREGLVAGIVHPELFEDGVPGGRVEVEILFPGRPAVGWSCSVWASDSREELRATVKESLRRMQRSLRGDG